MNTVAQYVVGQKVELIILRETDLGYVARVRDTTDEGLLYHNEVFELLEPNQMVPGYIRTVRADGRLDLILQPIGTQGAKDLAMLIIEILEENNGYLKVTDKTPAEEIHSLFCVSKKKFKIALGGLYKRRLITVSDDGIRLVKK